MSKSIPLTLLCRKSEQSIVVIPASFENLWGCGCTLPGTICWMWYLRLIFETPSLEVFRTWLGKLLRNLLLDLLWAGDQIRWLLDIPFKLIYSMIPWYEIQASKDKMFPKNRDFSKSFYFLSWKWWVAEVIFKKLPWFWGRKSLSWAHLIHTGAFYHLYKACLLSLCKDCLGLWEWLPMELQVHDTTILRGFVWHNHRSVCMHLLKR